MNTFEKIAVFAQKVEQEQLQRLKEQELNCLSNQNNHRTNVIPGKKYVKVNVGNSGRFMVEVETGNIFGTKGYGVIHRGHFYGTLDTIDEYFWGDYYPRHKVSPTAEQSDRHSCPKLTFAPDIAFYGDNIPRTRDNWGE